MIFSEFVKFSGKGDVPVQERVPGDSQVVSDFPGDKADDGTTSEALRPMGRGKNELLTSS